MLIQRLERGQQTEEGSRLRRLEDQPIAFLPDHGLGAGKLQVPRDPDGLISAIAKEANPSTHVSMLTYAEGMGQSSPGSGSSGALEGRRTGVTSPCARAA
jgi:hypothetical protein